jgi:hypothetical protein
MEGTRQEVIGKIVQWINRDSNQPMCWLHGAAGSGKSAISSTIAEMCAANNRLAGSFFFLRGAGSRSKITHFISTLAYNLAIFIPDTKPYIERVLQTDQCILCRTPERQFQQLIADPIRSVTMPTHPMIIIVDGLDECDNKEMIADFVDIVALAIRNYRLPLRFLFTSRVEELIRRRFAVAPALAATYRLALEDFNADDDLRRFFRSRFSTIYEQNRRVMRNITLPWPSESDLNILVEKSSGSFIFAFTLVNFVNDESDLPHRKLRAGLQSHTGLDLLYTQVLQTARQSPHFRRIFETIMTIAVHLSIMDLACLCNIEAEDVIHRLLGVQSILIIPEDDEQPIRPFHTSLRDFLTTETRSNNLCIDLPARHLSIASDCLIAMTVHGGNEFFESRGLRFASHNWIRHLLSAIQEEGSDNLLFPQQGALMMNKLMDFVSRSFDSWISSIIAQGGHHHNMEVLDSVLSMLKATRRCPSNMILILEKIKALAKVGCPAPCFKLTR